MAHYSQRPSLDCEIPRSELSTASLRPAWHIARDDRNPRWPTDKAPYRACVLECGDFSPLWATGVAYKQIQSGEGITALHDVADVLAFIAWMTGIRFDCEISGLSALAQRSGYQSP